MLPLLDKPVLRRRPHSADGAFSLVEVVLALGVVAFAFVAIFGLLPTGMGVFRQAMDTSVGSQIAQRVLNDAQQTDFAILVDLPNLPPEEGHITKADFSFLGPKVAAPAFRYFDDEGFEVPILDPAKVIYWVATRIRPRADSVQARPADLDTELDNLAVVTVQIINNPGNREPEIDPVTNLVKAAAGYTFTTHSGLVSRSK